MDTLKRKNKILIVEDEMVVAYNIQKKLENMDYTVTDVCICGEEAMQSVEHTSPHLILMDIKLEGKADGIETARSITEKYDIPIVYITAYADEEILEKAKLTAPYGYILKPFTDRELRSTIEVAFYKHKMEKELKQSEKRFRTIIQSMNNGLIVMDDHWNITFVNDQFCTLTGYSADEIFESKGDVLLTNGTATFSAVMNENMHIYGERSFEFTFNKKGEDNISVIISPRAFYDETHTFQGSVFTITDISRFKNLDLLSHPDSELLDEKIDENSDPAMLIKLNSWNIIKVNGALLEATGYHSEELLNRSVVQLANWREREALNTFLDLLNHKTGVQGYPVTVRAKNGERLALVVDTDVIEEDNSRYVLFTCRFSQ